MRENPDDPSMQPDRDEEPPRPRPSAPSDARFQGGSLRLFRVAGIDVFVHWSWAVVAMIRLQYMSEAQDAVWSYSSHLWNVIEYLSVFAIVLMHEFGHVLACRSVGGRANKIVLWPLGGVALVEPPPRPGAFLWCLAAGPLVNVVLVVPTVGLFVLSSYLHWEVILPDLHHFLVMLMLINGVLLVFNMLPIYPLDGGQILQALLWFVIGRARSLMVVTVIGFGVGLIGLTVTIAFQWWWYSLIALFVTFFSIMGFRNARFLLEMMQAPRREGAACPSCGEPPPVGEFWRCGSCLGQIDVFEWGGICPDCGNSQTRMPCTSCGRRSLYADWFPEVIVAEKPVEE